MIKTNNVVMINYNHIMIPYSGRYGSLAQSYRADETGAGHYRTVKGRKSDGMGIKNEQYTGVCKRGCERRIDL